MNVPSPSLTMSLAPLRRGQFCGLFLLVIVFRLDLLLLLDNGLSLPGRRWWCEHFGEIGTVDLLIC
jgi:hypothetical protein